MAYKENDVKEASKATAKGSVKVRIIGGEEMSMADYIKDDYLKRKEVLEYVLYHLLAETDYYELDEPQACAALLNEFREVNDPVRQFLGDVLPEASWDILSWQFVHDL